MSMTHTYTVRTRVTSREGTVMWEKVVHECTLAGVLSLVRDKIRNTAHFDALTIQCGDLEVFVCQEDEFKFYKED